VRPALKVFGWSAAVSALLLAAILARRAGVSDPHDLRIFDYLVLFQDVYAFPLYLGILLLALLAPLRRAGSELAAWIGEHPLAAAAAASVALAAGAVLVYRAHPLSMDEYAAVFQSRIFAAGHLTGRVPPGLLDWLIPSGVQGKFLKTDAHTGAIAATYWPGFALLLAPFALLGVPWLLNPLIGGATLLAMHRLGVALFGERRDAGLVVLATLASPAFSVNAMSYYAMPAHLLANALYALLLLRPTPARAFGAGVLGSYALVLHSPVPHLLFAPPWIAWLALRPETRRAAALLLAGYLPLCAALGFGWPMLLDGLASATTQGALAAGPLAALLGKVHMAMSWARDPGLAMRLFGFAKLWLWAVPGLVVLAVLGVWRLRRERGIWTVICASGALSYLGYMLIPFDQGHGWGYRYFHQAWLVLPLLAVAALRAVPQPSLSSYLAAASALSLALLTPFDALQVRAFISRDLAQVPPAAARVGVVILNPLYGYYTWDLAQNDPFLRNRPVVLISRGAEADRAMMAREFPGYGLIAADPRASQWGPR